jgi:hypothetical protein
MAGLFDRSVAWVSRTSTFKILKTSSDFHCSRYSSAISSAGYTRVSIKVVISANSSLTPVPASLTANSTTRTGTGGFPRGPRSSLRYVPSGSRPSTGRPNEAETRQANRAPVAAAAPNSSHGGKPRSASTSIPAVSGLALSVNISRGTDGRITVIQCYARGSAISAAATLMDACAQNTVGPTESGSADNWIATQMSELADDFGRSHQSYTSAQPAFGSTRMVLRESAVQSMPFLSLLLTGAGSAS